MTMEDLSRLSCYEELTTLGGHDNIFLVKNVLSGEIFVKKDLSGFSFDVYAWLKKENFDGIPRIHEMFLDERSDGKHLILIEDYIHGQTLEQLVQKRKKLSEQESFDIILKICDILKAVHRHSPPVIHRDLKLSNVILTRDEGIYLVDFDTARCFEYGLKEDTLLLGTKEYASPEQYGFRQSDTRSDIYALGVLFNRLLTGKYPKDKLTAGKFRPVISKCIHLDPEQRYQSVDELEMVLLRCMDPTVKVSRYASRFSISCIPGFRTNVLWKKISAVIGYFLIIWTCLTIPPGVAGSSNYLAGWHLWYERFFICFIFLTILLYNFDFLQIRSHSIRTSRLWLRILLQVCITITIFVMLIMIMILIEALF